MKNSILIDTENQIFKVNGEDVGDSEELIIKFSEGYWDIKVSKKFKINNQDLKGCLNDN